MIDQLINLLMIKMNEINISTQERYQLIDITDKVEEIVRDFKKDSVSIFVPHSTSAILLTEKETGLEKDWLTFLKKLISGFDFEHNRIDNNADSHIISGLIGQEKRLPLKNGKIIRGTWQQIFLLELDGPRERRVIVY